MQHALMNSIGLSAESAGGDGARRDAGATARRPWEAYADRAVLLTALLAVAFVALIGG